jgi:hypothetical protein
MGLTQYSSSKSVISVSLSLTPMSLLRWIFPVLILSLIMTSGCTDDIVPGEGSLLFSEDTVIFDTVFTTIGSVTKQFKVYNPSSDEVTISSIALARGQQSKYRINVDGVPGIYSRMSPYRATIPCSFSWM